MSGITNQEIAAVTARQKAWSKVREIIKAKIESPSKSGLDGAEHKRLTCQLEAVGVLWYPMVDLDEMTPEEALPLAQEAAREHAPELCDVIGIGWPVKIGALVTEPRPAATALHEAALAAKARTVGTESSVPNRAVLTAEQSALCRFIAAQSDALSAERVEEIVSTPPAHMGMLAWMQWQEITFELARKLHQEIVGSIDLAKRLQAADDVASELRNLLATAEAKAKAAERLSASANAAMQHLAGLCDCEAGSGCDRARIREQLRAALAAARAAGIGRAGSETEASQ